MPAATKKHFMITRVTLEIATPVTSLFPDDVGAAAKKHAEVWDNAARELERVPGYLEGSLKAEPPKMDKR